MFEQSENEINENCDNEMFKTLPLLLNGNFFKIIKIDNGNPDSSVQAECVNCKKQIKGRLNATTNFRNHLKVKEHPYLIQEYEKYIKTKFVHPKKRLPISSTHKDGSKPKKLKQTLLSKMSEYSEQTVADNVITNFICQTMSPLVLVEHEAFVKLVKGMCELKSSPKIMCRKTLATRINSDYIKMMDCIKGELQSVKYVCTTADVWSINRRSFMGVTVHWITEDLKRKSFAIACRCFKGNHTYDKVAGLLNDINEEFIDRSKTYIVKTVTDNESNMIKTFNTFSQNKEPVAATSSHESRTDQHIVRKLTTDESLRSIVEIVYDDSEESDDEGVIPISNTIGAIKDIGDDILLPDHQRCASHTLSLITTTDIKQFTKNSNSMYSRTYNSCFAKCTSIWTLTNKSPKASEAYLDVTGKCPTSPCPTRWNSMFDCIVDLLKVKDKLNKACESINLRGFKEFEFEFLSEYLEVVRPFAETLDHLQGSDDTFYGELLPNVFRIHRTLQSFTLRHFKFCSELINYLIKRLNVRFDDYLKLSSAVNDAILAAVTYPFYKLRWVPKEHKGRLKQLLFNEMASITKNHIKCIKTEKNNEIPKYLFEETETSDSDGPEDNVNTLHLQGLQFLQDSRTEICMLENYPEIKHLFLKFNTPLPSSAAVERLFSLGGMILRPKRKNCFFQEQTKQNNEIFAIL